MARLKDYFLPVQPDLPSQPCVVFVAARLQQHPSRIVGAMVMVWGLASQTGEAQGEDVALDLDADAIDALVGLPGFAATWAAWRPARPWFALDNGRAVCVGILKRIGGRTIREFEQARAEGIQRHRERARSCARVARDRAQPERNVAPELRPGCAEIGEIGDTSTPPTPPTAAPRGGGGGGGGLSAPQREGKARLRALGVSPTRSDALARTHTLDEIDAAVRAARAKGDDPPALAVALLERGDAAEEATAPEVKARQQAGRAWMAKAPRASVENAVRDFRAAYPDVPRSDAEVRGMLTFAEFVGCRLQQVAAQAAGGER